MYKRQVIDYLKNGRPVSDAPEIFLRAVAPYVSLQNFDNILIKHIDVYKRQVRDIVNRQGRKYTEHLLSAVMEAGFDLRAIPAVLLCGDASVGSCHLSPNDGRCKTIFLLDDKVNAGGFERALAAVSRRKSEAWHKALTLRWRRLCAKRFSRLSTTLTT